MLPSRTVNQAASTLAKKWQAAVKKELDKTPRLKALCQVVSEARTLRRQESAERPSGKGTGAEVAEGGKPPGEHKQKENTAAKGKEEAVRADAAAPAAAKQTKASRADAAAPAAGEQAKAVRADAAAPAAPEQAKEKTANPASDETKDSEQNPPVPGKGVVAKVDMDGQEIHVNDVVLMHATKHKECYHEKKGVVIRLNSAQVVVQVLEGTCKDEHKKMAYNKVKVIEASPPPEKQRKVEIKNPEPADGPERAAEPAGDLGGARASAEAEGTMDENAKKLFRGMNFDMFA